MEVNRYADGTHEDTEPALNTADTVGNDVETMRESREVTRAHSDSARKTITTCLTGRRLV